MNASRRRVGIMGGTFDPIHIGHLILGESAWQQFSLEKVLFMPSGNPPHKKGREGATNEQRVEMVRLAIASNPHFVLSLEEMHEKGYVYTKETLRRLRAQHPDTDYYFILGADSLLTFDKWYCWEEILTLADLFNDKEALYQLLLDRMLEYGTHNDVGRFIHSDGFPAALHGVLDEPEPNGIGCNIRYKYLELWMPLELFPMESSQLREVIYYEDIQDILNDKYAGVK